MRIAFTLFFLVSIITAKSQLLSWSPQFISESSASVDIIIDATKGNQGLKDYAPSSDVYVHIGAITSFSTGSGDWKHAPFTWGTTTTAAKCSYLGNNKWKYTIAGGLRAFFGLTDANEKIQKIAIVFRNGDGSRKGVNADGSDMFIPVYPAATNAIQFTQPSIVPVYDMYHEAVNATIGVSVPVTAVASDASGTMNLYFNGINFAGPVNGSNTITGNAVATVKGNQQLIAEFIKNGVSYRDTINYYITPDNVMAPLPAGVKEGINYNSNCTSATLVLYAPNKNNVVVVGDFPASNWVPTAQYQMNKTPDGNYYWLTINNLVAGTEYAFNYRVDDTIYIADPYTEKVLDPYNDPYIPATSYPGLKSYPINSNVSASKNGIMSVLQTCQLQYNWRTTQFPRPDKRNLITYELLVRDFGDLHNYQMLIDTISYFKRLGINAIELMPVNEFNGNDSWGYNPTFYCALDKYYGTKNKLKEFIDLCHQNGIVVIMDVVYNQMEAGLAPQGRLYWDAAKNRPTANNPWLNIAAPHPYFDYQYDLNHESPATRYLVQRSMEYWLTEYRIDGFRIDAGKGFTQKCTQVNEMCPVATGSIEDYDASRVLNLERYYDSIQAKFPNTYMIIEFLGQQRQEEQEYAKHGFLLWGNNNPAYNQATMGYDNSNFSKIVYNSGEEAFTTPSEMGYMESHDEERLMFKNLAYGNSNEGYNVKNVATALERQAAAAAVFFTVPGPKMIWQFGERGYDVSIDSGNRVAHKAPHWEYMSDPNRLKLWDTYSKLINLRLSYPATFNNTKFSYDFYDNGGLFKRFQIADPNGTGLKVTAIANFDVVPQTRTITFQSTGTWYSFVGNGTGAGLNGAAGSAVDITSATQTVTLKPGEYHVYLDRQTTLPLKLLSFNALRSGNNISLTWTTTNEVNVKQFNVERSLDGTDFKTISVVNATNTYSQVSHYSAVDNDRLAIKTNSKLYYRLKMLDIDGGFSYSGVQVIDPALKNNKLSISPNPVKGTTMFITVNQTLPAKVQVKIEDVSGRLYRKYTTTIAGAASVPVDVSKLSNGIYLIKLETTEQTFIQQFLLQH